MIRLVSYHEHIMMRHSRGSTLLMADFAGPHAGTSGAKSNHGRYITSWKPAMRADADNCGRTTSFTVLRARSQARIQRKLQEMTVV